MTRKCYTAAMLLLFAPILGADSTRIGILHCEAVEGTRVNLLVRSTVDVVCTFERAEGAKEVYRGETGIAFGLDLSFRSNEQFGFTVLSAGGGASDQAHALAGRYVGLKAGAAVGVGLGAATLVGGSDSSFGLQPLALEFNNGFGLAGGIGFLSIEPM